MDNKIMCVYHARAVTSDNCSVCKRSIAQKPSVCMRDVAGGMSAEDSIAQLPARDSIHKLPTRARRQAHLCTHANVISWRECCGGKQRPLRITCDVFGAQSWASCLTCRDYTASETPAKRNPTKS